MLVLQENMPIRVKDSNQHGEASALDMACNPNCQLMCNGMWSNLLYITAHSDMLSLWIMDGNS